MAIPKLLWHHFAMTPSSDPTEHVVTSHTAAKHTAAKHTAIESAQGVAAPVAGYANAVLTVGPSRIFHSSGIVPRRPDGSVPETIAEQSKVIWDSMLALLAEVKMGPENVVSVVTYVVVGNELAPVMAARDAALGGRLAASTLVVVPALVHESWKLEIAVVATD